MDLPPDPSVILDPHNQALQRLISREVPQNELATLIETVFSDRKVIDLLGRLRGSEVQAFIDVIDEALDDNSFSPRIRGNCVRSLYKMCAGHSLLPRSLQIEVQYDRSGVAHCGGGFADVWKGHYGDRQVAVKVLRIYSNSNLQKITRGFCKEFLAWKTLNHQNVLPLLGVLMTETQFATVSEWMTNGNINQFVEKHWDVNRFELLEDVARGLIYMHDQGMVHGDLKGANILVDQDSHARLADFGLLRILSDSKTLSSYTPGGTTRWMSPELFDPELPGNPRTKYSDCYALGMVIYEVLSGRVPFYQYDNFAVPVKVCGGERPVRPEGSEGVWLMSVWVVLERCWTPQPNKRPATEEILQCLVEASRVWTPPSPPAVASLSTTDSPTWNPFDITFDSITDGGEVGHLRSVAIPVTPFPPNWIRVPQRIYEHGRKQWNFVPLTPISFNVDGRPGINMGDAFRKMFTGLDGRDDPVLMGAAGAISCRLLFPGYPDNGASCQINVLSWTRDRLPITRSKLAREVARKLKRYLDSMAGHPIDESTDKRWKVGEGFMHLENMFLVCLESVSKGSFQPEICVTDPSTPHVRAEQE